LADEQKRIADFPTCFGTVSALGAREAQEGPEMTVLIYVNTGKQVGDAERRRRGNMVRGTTL